MGVFTPDPAPHQIHRVHRAGAGALGGFLIAFGLIGSTRAVEFLSTTGPIVMGLSTNGLLATLSLIVGALLVAAAVRGGPMASTVAVTVGGLFLLSGVGNVLVLDSPLNMLAFQLPNVVFSLLVGAALLFVGAYGRFTGSLPANSPYSHAAPERLARAPYVTDGTLERAMAAAERAVAAHSATADQVARVRAASMFRTHEARRRAFASPN